MSKKSKTVDPDSSLVLSGLELEEPVSPELSETGGLLFSEQLPMVVGKLNMAESLLGLLVKNIKFSEFLREILLTVARVVPAEAGAFLEVNASENVLFFRAVFGHSSDKIKSITVPFGHGVVGHVAESRQPLRISDTDENHLPLKYIQKAVSFEAKNIIAVPVIVRGRVFGVIELLNRKGEPTFTEADLDLLMQFTGYIAKAVEIRLMLAWAMNHVGGNEGPVSEAKAA